MNLHSFLNFGFFFDNKNPYLARKFQFDIDKERYKHAAELTDLVEIGTAKLIKSFEIQFPLNKSHLLPLSGGLDSRNILSCLLEFIEAHNINNLTFGSPIYLRF
jgi:outer membrane protein OmpA-like peptidoglycan-associated protein